VSQLELLEPASALPAGLLYAPDFISAAEEQNLLEVLRELPFQQAQYKEWRARRRVVSFGGRYDFSRHTLTAAAPIPQFLHPLRARIAAWAGLEGQRIAHAMIAEYQPGTPLGWHRDVPDFDEIAGVSLHGHARLRLRPWPPQPHARATHALDLEPRSAYTLRGVARWGWQHAISPTKELRYSITFRTRRP
jgi:alkylated DNA repair dioxygenase AlkB